MGKLTFGKILKYPFLSDRYSNFIGSKILLSATISCIINELDLWAYFIMPTFMFVTFTLGSIHVFSRGYYTYPDIQVVKKLDIGRMSIIPDTAIIAYMITEKKNDFKIFDYDGGIIVNYLNKWKGVEKYVNIRVEYEKFDSIFSFKRTVGSFRSQLGTKWGKRMIVDLNDPDYKEKYFARLKEAEDARKK